MAREECVRGNNGLWDFKPIGFIQSVFHFKNGTPRQPSVCSFARGSLTIIKDVFNNPEHALEGLEEFSHVWLMFLFHKNSGSHCKAKVKPPRLNGKRVGVFSTRSPHRPNAIGLSLVRLEAVKGATLYLSGLDLLDGTPVLDIKPYIPAYDCPAPTSFPPSSSPSSSHEYASALEICGDMDQIADAEEDCSLSVEADTSNSSSCGGDREDTSSKCENYVMLAECELDGRHGDAETPKDCDCLPNAESKTLRTHQRDCAKTRLSFDTSPFKAQREPSDIPCTQYRGDTAAGNTKETKNMPSGKPHVSEQDTLEFTCKTTFSAKSDSQQKRMEESSEADDAGKVTAGLEGAETREVTPSCLTSHAVSTAQWVSRPPVSKLTVCFTERALQQLSRFSPTSSDPLYQLQLLGDASKVREGVEQVLQEDPRSVYRRTRCLDSLYFFALDTVHFTCWFDQDVAEVVRVLPKSLISQCRTESL